MSCIISYQAERLLPEHGSASSALAPVIKGATRVRGKVWQTPLLVYRQCHIVVSRNPG